jgi:hypothetical protein
MARQVEADDLELYAINTSQFYGLHKALATRNHAGGPATLEAWRKHVKATVLPRYCREIEPVTASEGRINLVAMSLKDYYENHVKEL